jgi:hypothetical protein
MENRRWRRTAFAVGSVAVLVALAPRITTAGAARAAGISPIRHVVYLIQENHSFDNLLGAWCVQTGRCVGATTGQLSDGTTIALGPATDVVPPVDHLVGAQTTAVDGGKMDGFDLITGCSQADGFACYTQFSPSQTPDPIKNVIRYASTFAISDRTFEDGLVPSWGSHLSAVTANLDGFQGDIPKTGPNGIGNGWGCDSGDVTTWVNSAKKKFTVPSCVPDYNLNRSKYPYGGAFAPTPVPHVETIMDELDEAGLSWKIYAATSSPKNSNGYGWSICPTFADCIYTPDHDNLKLSSDVIADANSGTLPAFSIVTPDEANSQHNGDSMTVGDDWIGKVVNAIMNGPDWDTTAIFLTWDDCGCFYDHVPPPTGVGIRVPMIIISPYARPGYTDSTDAQFASVLAFTEHTFGLPALSSVDANAYDYSGAFNYSQSPLPPLHDAANQSISRAEQHQIATTPSGPDDDT